MASSGVLSRYASARTSADLPEPAITRPGLPENSVT